MEDDNDSIALLTGLESYTKFKFVFETLGPAAYDLNYPWSQIDVLSPENQFLLTLVKLRKHYSNNELAMFFRVSEKTVSNTFTTWINIMYFQWRELDIWPEKDNCGVLCPIRFQQVISFNKSDRRWHWNTYSQAEKPRRPAEDMVNL